MSLQHTEVAGDGPLIPRPERTPAALRAACAVVAPQLVAAYDQAKDQALADAVAHGSLVAGPRLSAPLGSSAGDRTPP
ncbi:MULTISPECIES: hypothetical protein [unclassified Streptomyces]|uniref:hypothetical protein n=1 Tax=unclassified Streptomyces TaxID=2593676 RepID=UPI00224EF8CF|nr:MULTISPECIES: hypothetical protein [unclassified Streptomyces]MCX5333286.1 hypothetical protein [Streptomyces sp. NBC_00140]MCX5362704.1 hypothetical protein [Streptomyces sp. NBC_00124]